MEPAQSTKLQTDDSSSSSPSSGSDDDLNTGMPQVALAGQQESLDERPPASSSELDLEEEFQIQQHHSTTTAPLGNQQTEVNIVEGDYRGAQIVGSQTTHQHYNLTKQEFIDQRQTHQTINVLQQQPDKKKEKKVISSEMKETEGLFQLSDSIQMFKNKPISSRTNIFYGEQVSDITDPRPIAIKLIPYDEKNVREAKLLLKLHSHPNVVSIVHSGIIEQGPMSHIYIAMELCHEQNLYDHVIAIKNNNVPFDPQLSIFQAKQLVEGLSCIHSNNIIHRDLKPHNVFLSLDKKSLKIADFGISKPMTRGLTKTRVTNVGAGTDGYRAPETFNNDEISQKADIYSLGLIFYFLWSNGHHPFGEDPVGWNYKIKTNQRYDLSKLLVSDQEMATDLLQWMLQFEAVNRPTTAQILSHKLFGGSLVSPGAETLPKAPATSSASGARSKLQSSSSSDVGRSRDEQQASTSTEQPKETSSSFVMTAEQRSEKATLASTSTSATGTKRKVENSSASDVGNQPGTSGVQQTRRVSELEDQAVKMIEIADKLSIDEKAALLKHIKALFNDDIIPKHETLTLDKIDLSGEQLTEEDIDAVAYVVSRCTNLHTLDLHDCCLLKTSVRRLEQELQPGVQISFLNIKGNEDFDLDDLLAAVDIKKKCNIEELLYDGNLTRKEKQEFDIYLKRSEIVGENVEGGDLEAENDMKIETASSKGKAWLKEEIRHQKRVRSIMQHGTSKLDAKPSAKYVTGKLVSSIQETKEKECSESHNTQHEVTGKPLLRETNNKTDIQTKTEAVAENKNYNPNALIKQRHEMTMLGLNIKEGKKERLQKWLQDPNTPSQAFSVGHEGGVIELKDCKVTFDVGTFDDFATVWVTEEVDSSKWPAGYIGISPMLYLECDREILKPVNIEMTTWCVSDGSDKGNRVKAEILHKADGDTKWKSLDNFPLPLNPLVEFKCQDFSPILVAIRNFFLGNQKFPISGFLYVKGDDEFHSGFFLKNETLETKMEGKLKKLGGEVKLYYNTMVLEMNDTVHLEFSCESESFRFQPADGSSFNINTDFVRLKHDTILYSVLRKANNSTVSGNNKFYVTANVKENDNLPRSYPFSHQWQSQDVAKTALLSQSPSVAHSPPDHPDSKTATGQEEISPRSDEHNINSVDSDSIPEANNADVKHENSDCLNIVEQEITPEGGVIRIRHCVITFPRGAVSKNTTFILSHIVDSKTKVVLEDFTEITPAITCTPAVKFNVPIHISLTTWVELAHGKHVTCSVFARNKGQLKCIDEKPISNHCIKFSTLRFEMVCGGVEDKIADKYSAIVTYFLCVNDERNFKSVCCMNDDELIKKLKAGWMKSGYKIIFAATDTIKVPFDTELSFQLTCADNQEGLKFKQNEAKSVKINKHFRETESDTVSFILIIPEGVKFPREVEFNYKAGDKDHPKLIKLPVKIEHEQNDRKYVTYINPVTAQNVAQGSARINLTEKDFQCYINTSGNL